MLQSLLMKSRMLFSAFLIQQNREKIALKHVKTARMLFYFQASDKCTSVPFDVSHLNYVPIVDSAEIKTSVKARIENILEQARNGEI